ncbi:PIN domain-containing protein [Streptomyces himalayensis]
MAPTIAVVDTCVLLAAYNRKDDQHEAAVAALGSPRVLVVSPLVLCELDHLLIDRVGERAAIDASKRLGALARLGHVQIAHVKVPAARSAYRCRSGRPRSPR